MKSEENIKKLIKNAGIDTNSEVNEKVLAGLLEELDKSTSRDSATSQPNIWRIIMKTKVRKFAAIVTLVIAVACIIELFDLDFGKNGLVFADMVEKVEKSKSVVWTMTSIQEGDRTYVEKFMVLEPYLMRREDQYGRVHIYDYSIGKELYLNPDSKIAILSELYVDRRLNMYDQLANPLERDASAFNIEQIGQRLIDGKQAIGFHLTTKEKRDFESTIWVDPETQLPIHIEYMGEVKPGVKFHSFKTDIVFDAKLEESLFSLEPPEGYELHPDPYGWGKTAEGIQKILVACYTYALEHGGQWPDSLEDIVGQAMGLYEITEDDFINPRQPERKIGYVYVKPDSPVPPQESTQIIVLYEAYDDKWESGITAGFADTHVKFFENKTNFEKVIKK